MILPVNWFLSSYYCSDDATVLKGLAEARRLAVAAGSCPPARLRPFDPEKGRLRVTCFMGGSFGWTRAHGAKKTLLRR